MKEFNNIINGEKVQSDLNFAVINPATGEVFAHCQSADSGMVDQAVVAARNAFSTWSKTSQQERKAKIHAIADALEANMPELMALVTAETGKPMAGLNGVGSGMEVGASMAWAHHTAELDLPVDVIQEDEIASVQVFRKPLGVVASITPWNWPLMIAIWHVMPALRAGNTVVIKPSPLTPLATIRFVEMANEILPPGVLSVITGDASIGAALSEHPDVNKIVFTGSTQTGRNIMQAASAHLKRLTLELGGNDAGFVLNDVNVKDVAPKLFAAAFHNNGQTCACLKRMYVHESIYEELCEELAQLAKTVVVGDGMQDGVELGPLQNKAQLAIVIDLVADAKAHGGRFIAGGYPIDGGGFFFAPTIVADLEDGHRLVDEEQFGPVVPIIKYSDISQIIERANQNENGLGGSIWSSDLVKAAELAQQLECGTAWVNDHGAIQPDAPFGGVKQSGFGVEFGSYGLEEYTSLQTVKITKN
ncbi:MAG: aldehyde dehydrogenase family protein [Cellvibrionales bacterium]|tara:strand:+ start:45503 stop:46927 length:1425 start_codon:yes stop_codon:yes gene_type:complete